MHKKNYFMNRVSQLVLPASTECKISFHQVLGWAIRHRELRFQERLFGSILGALEREAESEL
jgi:hypothetical protein